MVYQSEVLDSKTESFLKCLQVKMMAFKLNWYIFHLNGFALRLDLKQRHKGNRKWPIPKRDLNTKKTPPNIESLEAMLEY